MTQPVSSNQPAKIRPVPSWRGFSALEFLIALAFSSLVFAALMGLFIATVRSQQEGERRGALLRAGELAVARLEQDLRYAGTGTTGALGGGVLNFEQGLVLWGDFPRRDGNLPPLGLLRGKGGGRADLLYWENDLLGDAALEDAVLEDAVLEDAVLEDAVLGDGEKERAKTTVGASPSLGQGSLVSGSRPSEHGSGLCASTGSGPDEGGSRACPWGLRRALGGENLQVVTLAGRVAAARLSGQDPHSPPRLECVEGRGCGAMLAQVPTLASGQALALDQDAVAWVTTQDRVFWWQKDGVLFRRQCAGMAQTLTDLQPPGGDDAAPSCGPPERVALNVIAFSVAVLGHGKFVEFSLELSVDDPTHPTDPAQSIGLRIAGAGIVSGWM